mgnify:FL=1
MYISYCVNITDSHANVENVVKDARKPVITKVLILWDIIILFSKKPIKIPKINDPATFTNIIANGISKKIKFFRALLDR